jgi:hypothetical protein
MPTKYDPDTGIPYFVAEVAIELDEGVTPEPNTIVTSKRHLFAGDPPPKILGEKPVSSTTHQGWREGGKLYGPTHPMPPSGSDYFHRNKAKGALDREPKAKGALPPAPGKDDFPDRLAKAFGVEPEPPAGPPDSPVQTAYDEAFDVDKLAKHATPAALSAKIATDAEVAEIERLARDHSVMHWPTLMRLINRLRMTEELLRVERRNRA